MKSIRPNNGQALVTLLFFMVIAIIITTGAIIMIIVSSESASRSQQGNITYYTAESGVENAMIRLLRNPTYTGETLPINNGSDVIQVTGTNPYTITSTATQGNFVKKIQATATYNSNVLAVTSWKEIF